jgi:hypothetical protein
LADGLHSRIVCCIKFRLIESFPWHRHIDNCAMGSPAENSAAVPIQES